MTARVGLLDTSVFIAAESGRPLAHRLLPPASSVSVITIAELEVGVHAARDARVRNRRLQTLSSALDLDPIGVDVAASRAWAMLRATLAATGRRANVNDLWIAAIALSNEMPVVTQDDDFDVIAEVGGPQLVKV